MTKIYVQVFSWILMIISINLCKIIPFLLTLYLFQGYRGLWKHKDSCFFAFFIVIHLRFTYSSLSVKWTLDIVFLCCGDVSVYRLITCNKIVLFFPSSLIHSIVTRVIKLAKTKSATALAPALVETYSRLLVYMEIESLGIKGFISTYCPVLLQNCWILIHISSVFD